jgi:hypothetical protein
MDNHPEPYKIPVTPSGGNSFEQIIAEKTQEDQYNHPDKKGYECDVFHRASTCCV